MRLERALGMAALMVVIGLTAYGGYWLKRYVHWNFGYSQEVRKTVKDMVKEDCLKAL